MGGNVNTRLSLSERGNVAFKLRAAILRRENPERLEILNYPAYQPHEALVADYAFEFFMDKFRVSFREYAEDGVAYSIGWVKMGLKIDEESRSRDKIARLSTSMIITKYWERD